MNRKIFLIILIIWMIKMKKLIMTFNKTLKKKINNKMNQKNLQIPKVKVKFKKVKLKKLKPKAKIKTQK